MTPHDADRRFLEWVRRARPRELLTAFRFTRKSWHRVAIARAAKRLEVAAMRERSMLGSEDCAALLALATTREWRDG